MLQSSRLSLQTVLEAANAEISTGEPREIGEGLLAVVAVLAENVQLRKALADSSESAEKKQRMSAMTLLSRTESMISQSGPVKDREPDDEYWGSLPAQLVQSYERRLEEICVDFDAIDFEELKTFVLEAHSQAGVGEASIDDSIGAIGAATDLNAAMPAT